MIPQSAVRLLVMSKKRIAGDTYNNNGGSKQGSTTPKKSKSSRRRERENGHTSGSPQSKKEGANGVYVVLVLALGKFYLDLDTIFRSRVDLVVGHAKILR